MDGRFGCVVDIEKKVAFVLKLEGRRSIVQEGGVFAYFSDLILQAIILPIKSCSTLSEE